MAEILTVSKVWPGTEYHKINFVCDNYMLVLCYFQDSKEVIKKKHLIFWDSNDNNATKINTDKKKQMQFLRFRQ